MKTLHVFHTLAIIALTITSLHAQVSFSHDLGFSVYVSPQATAPGITYSPRVNLISMGEEATISLGTHLGAGLLYNSQSGAGYFALDIPVVAELNLGHACHPNSGASFGGFAGAGYGISLIGSQMGENNARGPVFNAGIRALIDGRSAGLRASFLLNQNEGNNNVLGIGLFYTFGDF